MITVYETRNLQNEINDRNPIDVCSFLQPTSRFIEVLTLTATLDQCYSFYFGKIAPVLKLTDVLSIWEKIASSFKLSDSVQRNIKHGHGLSSSVT